MTERKPKRLGGSSVARIAGNILSGMLANEAFSKPVSMTVDEALDRATAVAWHLALQIAQKAEAYDAEGEK